MWDLVVTLYSLVTNGELFPQKKSFDDTLLHIKTRIRSSLIDIELEQEKSDTAHTKAYKSLVDCLKTDNESKPLARRHAAEVLRQERVSNHLNMMYDRLTNITTVIDTMKISGTEMTVLTELTSVLGKFTLSSPQGNVLKDFDNLYQKLMKDSNLVGEAFKKTPQIDTNNDESIANLISTVQKSLEDPISVEEKIVTHQLNDLKIPVNPLEFNDEDTLSDRLYSLKNKSHK